MKIELTRNKLIALGLGLIVATIAVAVEQKRVDSSKEKRIEKLNLKLQSFAKHVEDWDNLNTLALSNLVKQADIISMKPELQKPVLENMVKTYQHLYLAHTVDLTGHNIGRSDSNPPKFYGNRDWFAGVKLGIDINRQTVMGFSNNAPALCVGAPIRDGTKILGAATLCTDLSDLAKVIGQTHLGQTGYLIVVDRRGRVLLHPNSVYLSGKKLKDFSDYPPVKHLLEGREGEFTFSEENEQKWYSFGKIISNEWKVMLVISNAEIQPRSHLPLILSAIALGFIVFLANLVIDALKTPPQPFVKKDERLTTAPEVIDAVTISPPMPPKPPKLKDGINARPHKGEERRILIVDDNIENQQYCYTILTALRFQVITTSNSESAYNIVANQRFDLILTNLNLRIGSGKAMMFRLRENPAYEKVPIIGISDRIAEIKDRKKYLSGFTDFLSEPLEKKQLIAKISKHLNLSWKVPNTRVVQFRERKINVN